MKLPPKQVLCVKLFQEMGGEVSILDINIAHRVSTRNEREGPKPVVRKFVRHYTKGKVVEVRQRAFQVNPTSISLSAESELGGARIFDHSLLFRDARAVQMLLIALRQIMPVLPFSEITFSIELR